MNEEDNQVAPTNHNDATIISITESGSKNTSKRNSALPSSLPKKEKGSRTKFRSSIDVSDDEEKGEDEIQRELRRAQELEMQDRKEYEKQKAREDINNSKFQSYFANFCLFTLPLTNNPLGPTLMLFLLITFLGLLFMYVFPNVTAGGPYLYSWFFWGDFLLISYIIIHIMVKVVLVIIKGVFFFSRFYYYVNGLAGTLTIFFWSIAQISSWTYIVKFDSSIDNINSKAEFWITNLLTCFIYISLCRTVKLVFVKAIIAYSQRNTFWKSLADLLFKEKVLKILLKKPKQKNLHIPLGFFTSVKKFSLLNFEVGKNKSKSKNKVDLSSPMLTPGEFRKAWKNVFHFESVEIEKSKKARDAVNMTEVIETAKKLYGNIDVDEKGHFTLEDIKPFFKNLAAAEQAFEMFDKNKDKLVVFEEVVLIVAQIYKDRKSLYATLHDREDIASILTNGLGVLFWFLMLLLSLSIFGINMSNLLLPIGTGLLSLAFIFGESFKDLWQNFIFVWQVRPFDVGDRIVVGTFPTLIIHHIHLTYTEAFSTDGRSFLLPNAFLRSQVIANYKRSRDYAVWLVVNLGSHTKREHVEKLQKKIRKWLKNDTQAPWKADDCMMWVSNIENLNKLSLELWVELRGVNWQAPSLYLIPKSRLWMAIQQFCKELNIDYHLPPQHLDVKQI